MVRERWFAWAMFAALLAALDLPVLTTPLPPLLDYPNHLARMGLLAAGGNVYWRPHWTVLPNLAEDVFVWVLAHGAPVEVLSRAFLALTVAAVAGGAATYARALHGRLDLWSLTALLFVWNSSLLWGFLNFTFGLGLALFGAAAWAADEPRPSRRALAAAAFGLAIWFSHIEAFAIYAMLIVGWEIEPLWERARGRAAESASPRLIALAAVFAVPMALNLFVWRANATANFEVRGLWRKPELLLSPFDNYSWPLDVLSIALVLCLFAGLLYARRIVVLRRAWPVLALLLLAFLAAPNHVYAGGGADKRLPAVILIVFVAASVAKFPSRFEARVILGALLALFLVRMAVLETYWRASQAIYEADIALIDRVEPGARIAVGQPVGAIKYSAAPELHLPLLATLRRNAFVPSLFAYPEQQPISATPLAERLRALAPETGLWTAFVDGNRAVHDELAPGLAQYDYLLLVARKPFAAPADPVLQPVGETPTFKLYRVKRAS